MSAPDVLGEPFTARSLPLRATPEGEAVATLVHRPATADRRGAMLYLHGFNDYFFQVEVADHFAGRGFDFYAVDLRGYGRSLRSEQLPNFVTDLSLHFEELDEAVRVIREEAGHRRLVLMAHSTGGLVAPLWAHERRHADLVDALVLNSPWFDLAENWFLRTVGTRVIDAVGARWPKWVIPKGLSPVYGQSIHATHHGEWDYRTDWKPVEPFPVRAGWLRAVRRAQARLQRGLDVRVPVLVLHSDRSLLHVKEWTADTMRADTVLDVEHMVRWAPKVGSRVTVVEIAGGMHDLFLSAEPVRRRALAEVDAWLETTAED